MKIFDVDVSVKYISFNLNGEKYLVQFRYNLIKGVHDVSVLDSHGETNAKITTVYPPLISVLYDLWRIEFPLWVKFKLRRLRHNR